ETANITLRMSNAQLAQFSNVFGTTGTKIITSDALFDLSGRSTGTVAFLSDNAAGTLFKVSSAAAAFQVVGGSGQDGVEAVGFTFTVDQRTALLNGASVEYIVEGNTIHGGSGNNALTGGAANNTIYGNAGHDTINGGAGADILYGGDGNDTFVFQAGQTNGDSILDFSGNGAGAGDSLVFEGFGTAAAGASFVQLDATHWQVNSADGTLHEIITVTAGTVFNPADITFG
ncbi:MAG TPA: calcium-binding protein, partial [Allosphingosinicella sp.]